MTRLYIHMDSYIYLVFITISNLHRYLNLFKLMLQLGFKSLNIDVSRKYTCKPPNFSAATE